MFERTIRVASAASAIFRTLRGRLALPVLTLLPWTAGSARKVLIIKESLIDSHASARAVAVDLILRPIIRRPLFAGLLGALLLAVVPRASGQTLDWGSKVFSELRDSHGQALDQNLFVFELGAFLADFIPDPSNVDEWFSNWRIFDQAAYNQSIGYFTSQVPMNDNGTSSYSPSGPSFEGLEAYLWIRNDTNPVEGTEWLLVRAADWVFPIAIPGCCDNDPPTQWSVSDLTGDDVPVWGSQRDSIGGGVYTVTGTYDLQTYTFIPEPSSPVLIALATGLLLRRRR